MKNENIDNPERLQRWINEQEELNGRVITAIDKLSDQPLAPIDQGVGGWSDEKKYGFGKLIKSLVKGEINQIGDIEYKGEKALAGAATLLTDAVTGSSVTGEQYVREILALAEDMSHLRPLVRKVNMTDRVTNIPDENAKPDFTYVSSDGGALAEGTMTFSTPLVLTAYVYSFWISFTASLLEDSLINLGDYFARKTAGAWARKFDYELLRGSGSPTTGVMEHASATGATMSDVNFDGVSSSDLFSTLKALDTEAKRDGAYWIFHPTVGDIIFSIQDANGRYMFRDALTMGPAGRILGYPWIYSGQQPASTDTSADTAMLCLGNPRNLVWGDRITLEIKKFDQMESAMEYDEVVLRARVRAAFAVSEPTAWSVLKTAAS